MVEVAPIRLKKKMQRVDVPDALIRGDHENVVKDERIVNGVGVTNSDEHQTKNKSACAVVEFSERVHQRVPLARALGR